MMSTTAGRKTIAVIGGGLAGLVSAYRCSTRFPNARVVLIEASKTLGGCIRTVKIGDSFVDCGPHSIRMGPPARSLLGVLQDLNASSHIIKPCDGSTKRFIYAQNKRVQLPNGLASLLRFPQLLFWASLEPFRSQKKRTAPGDETIESFAKRRFGSYVAKNFIDPMCYGIYACHMGQLSVRSCFPILKHLENQYGSVFLGMMRDAGKFMRQQYTYVYPCDTTLFDALKTQPILNFKNGMSMIPASFSSAFTLHNNIDVLLNDPCVHLSLSAPENNGCNLHKLKLASGLELSADVVISAIPANHLRDILKGPQSKTLIELLSQFAFTTVHVVNLIFDELQLKSNPPSGFGHLIPSQDQRDGVLGVIYDSSLFKEHDTAKPTTRLSVMLGGDTCQYPETQADLIRASLKHVADALGIHQDPIGTHVHTWSETIPKYKPNHIELTSRCMDEVQRLSQGSMVCVGASYYGVSLNDVCHFSLAKIDCIHL